MHGRRTDVTPYRCPVNDIAVPDDGIDEENKASQTSPSHVKTCSSVPGCVIFKFELVDTQLKPVDYLLGAIGKGCSRE